jgi:hypothetical protein
MKRLTGLAIGIVSLIALGGVAQAGDLPTKQEGRIWAYQSLTLAFSPNWSLTSMPGARVELARSKEDKAGLHFLEYFIGPNYTYKFGPNLTVKGSLWYYYMGYPAVGRNTMPAAGGPAACANNNTYTCNSNYTFSHNLEIIPSAEYRFGRWSIYDRVIFHNTFYADTYNKADQGISISDQRWGFGTVLRELLEVRYALTDRLGVSLADEVFFGIKEDSDTRKLRVVDANKNITNTPAGYTPAGYWKSGYRLNRVYAGFDYKVTPALTVAPKYLLEIMSSPTDGSDITDVSHTLFVTISYVAKLFEDKK